MAKIVSIGQLSDDKISELAEAGIEVEDSVDLDKLSTANAGDVITGKPELILGKRYLANCSKVEFDYLGRRLIDRATKSSDEGYLDAILDSRSFPTDIMNPLISALV